MAQPPCLQPASRELNLPTVYLGGTGCSCGRKGLLLLSRTEPGSGVGLKAARVWEGVQKGGGKAGGSGSHSACLLYIFCSSESSDVVYSSTCNVQLHPIALTMRHSSSGLSERMTMTLLNKVGALQLFFSSLQGRTRPYKAEWLVACQGILKNSSLCRRTCLFFPGSLGSLFPQ